jgi:hypothetical protein
MPGSAPYDDLLMEMLKDEERALAYLNAALDEQDPRVFLIALRNVTQAHAHRPEIAVEERIRDDSSTPRNAVMHALGPQLQFLNLKTNHTIPNTSNADADASTGCNARANRFKRENTSAKIAMAMISAAAAPASTKPCR